VLADLAQALNVSTDEWLGVKTNAKMTRAKKVVDTDNPEMRRVSKKFQQLMTLPEKDQRAVIRLVNSLVETKGRAAAGGSR